MSLAPLLEKNFRGDVRFRGAAYIEAERVAITRVTPDTLFAVVRDGVEYQTQLSREEGALRLFCSCSADKPKLAGTCKHLWATILTVDIEGYLAGLVRTDQMPPFVHEEPVGPPIDFDEWDDDLDTGDVYEPRRQNKQATPTVEKPKARLKDWESRLQSFRKEFNDSAQSSADKEREIFYEVDVEQSQETGKIVVQTSQRQRRANGQWGKLKALKLKAGQLDDIDREEDRKVLAYLLGSTPERGNWYAQQKEVQSATYRYMVPYELCELILPVMCSTGRLRFLGTSETKSETLEWDAGDPWSFCLSMRHPNGAATWQLVGHAKREDEVLAIGQAQLIVPGGLLFHNGVISRLNDFGASEWVQLLGAEKPFEVPEGDEQEFVDAILDMPTLPQLDLPEQLKLEEVHVVPTPSLLISSPRARGWKHERLRGAIEFDYAGTRVKASSSQWAIVQRDQNRCLVRDREFEAQGWSRLQDLGVRRLLDHRRSGADIDIAATDLGTLARTLIAEGWELRADGHQVHQAGNVHFKVQSGIDWFELSADVDFDGRGVAFPELLSALSRGDNTVRLDDGSLGILPEEWLEQFGLLAGLGTAEGDHVRFSNTQAGLLDALLAVQDDVTVDQQFEDMRERLRSFEGVALRSGGDQRRRETTCTG